MREANTNSMSIVRWSLLAAPFIVGLVALVLVRSDDPVKKQATVSAPIVSESPAPDNASHVTVNGKVVPPNPDGSVHVSLSSDKGDVESPAPVTTTVTTYDSRHSSASGGQNGNVNVDIDSTTVGGNNSGSTQVYGYSATNNGSSMSFSRTNVFSSGSSTVQTTSP